jgi:hypothetical protein
MTMILLWASLAATIPQGPQFHPPVRLATADGPIRVEAPGYASPAVHDLDKDGKPDLVVGQFRDGKMTVYKGLGDGKFAAGSWLQAEGETAKVPGVW